MPTDLAKSLFAISKKKEDQVQFAFTWNDQQYTFMVLSQDYAYSPTLNTV